MLPGAAVMVQRGLILATYSFEPEFAAGLNTWFCFNVTD